MIFLSMLALGALIGFVGAGGAGVTITLLNVGFGIPIHEALAVALASMVFTTLSGAISHFRQHEVVVRTGAIVGLFGIIGAFLGAAVSNIMPAGDLTLATSAMMLLSAVLLYLRIYQGAWLARHFPVRETLLTGRRLYVYGSVTGVLVGFLSAAFIQLALMVVFGVPLLQTVGTCMMVIIPISAAGGLGYLLSGHLEPVLFLETLLGLMLGAWFGAKATHLAPLPLLKFCIVGMSAAGGVILLLFH